MDMHDKEVKAVSTATVLEVELDIKDVDEDKLVIMDKLLNYVFMFKKGKRGLRLYVGVRGKQPAKCNLGKIAEDSEDKLVERIRNCLLGAGDEGIHSALDQFVESLVKLYAEWETRLEDLEAAKEMERLWREAPKLVVQTATGPIKIMDSDGYTLSLRGGVVPNPSMSRSFAVIETTYVLARKPVMTRKGGITEVEKVIPIFIIAEYHDGRLDKVRIEDPEAGVIKVLDSIPVRIEAKSVARSTLPTLLDIEAIRKWIEGKETPEPPTFREAYEEVLENVRHYVCYSWDERLYYLNASYIMATYFYDFFTAFPRLFFHGPYGTGKTRAMLTTIAMSWHGFPMLDPSDASVYRSIEAFGLTLGIDEGYLKGGVEKIIAAGYKRGLKVPRVDKASKDSFELSFFDTYAPVVLAFTELPSELVAQRTIIVNMEKCDDPNPGREDPDIYEFKELRNKLYLLRLLRANEFVEAMSKVREAVKDVLRSRDYEVWYPILVAAYLGGEEAFCAVLCLALEDLEQRQAALYSEEKLVIKALERLLGGLDEVAFMTTDLVKEIHDILINEEGYTEKEAQREWTARRVGRVLNRLGIRKKSERVSEKGPRQLRYITREKLEELKEKYGLNGTQVTFQKILNQLANYNCSQNSQCSKKFGEVGSGAQPSPANEGAMELERGESGTHLSEKPTTPTTLTTSATLEQFIRESNQSNTNGRIGVLDAIIEIVGKKGKATDIDIYQELVVMEKEGKLVEGVVVNYDKVVEWLATLEGQDKLAKIYDDREGREYYVLP
jgi:hypothetical protein